LNPYRLPSASSKHTTHRARANQLKIKLKNSNRELNRSNACLHRARRRTRAFVLKKLIQKSFLQIQRAIELNYFSAKFFNTAKIFNYFNKKKLDGFYFFSFFSKKKKI